MRDVDAWVVGMLGAPVAIVLCPTVAYVVGSGTGGAIMFFVWQLALSFVVLSGSILLSPIAFLISEQLGIARSSKRAFAWLILPLAAAFSATFSFAMHYDSLMLLAAVVGVALNVAVFGAVYARSNSSCSGREVDSIAADARR
jgi:hypothetical protein